MWCGVKHYRRTWGVCFVGWGGGNFGGFRAALERNEQYSIVTQGVRGSTEDGGVKDGGYTFSWST